MMGSEGEEQTNAAESLCVDMDNYEDYILGIFETYFLSGRNLMYKLLFMGFKILHK